MRMTLAILASVVAVLGWVAVYRDVKQYGASADFKTATKKDMASAQWFENAGYISAFSSEQAEPPKCHNVVRFNSLWEELHAARARKSLRDIERVLQDLDETYQKIRERVSREVAALPKE